MTGLSEVFQSNLKIPASIIFLLLTKILLCVMVTWSMIPQFVIGIHPIALIIEIFKTYHSIVQFPGTVLEDLIALCNDKCGQEYKQSLHNDQSFSVMLIFLQLFLPSCCLIGHQFKIFSDQFLMLFCVRLLLLQSSIRNFQLTSN